jgi:hypothetical protein
MFKKINNYQKLQIVGGEGRGGEGGELSYQCLRPSTSLMAAGNNNKTYSKSKDGGGDDY